MAQKFAADTSVSVEKSRADIETVLRRYGADKFASGWDRTSATIAFQVHERMVRSVLPLPDPDDAEFTLTPSARRQRSRAQAQAAWEQACRSRWRSLHLVIKAKLEAIDAGIAEFEDEFMAHLVLPDGRTVSEHVRPQIDSAYDSGRISGNLMLEAGS